MHCYYLTAEGNIGVRESKDNVGALECKWEMGAGQWGDLSRVKPH